MLLGKKKRFDRAEQMMLVLPQYSKREKRRECRVIFKLSTRRKIKVYCRMDRKINGKFPKSVILGWILQ
jgi:hypothetical protein